MNEANDPHFIFVAIFFALLALAAFWELLLHPYSSFLALSGCGGAAFAAYLYESTLAHRTTHSDSGAAAAALLFYRDHVSLQDKDLAYLRQRTASLAAEVETKTREVADLNKKVSVLEADLAQARARGAQDPPHNTLPQADKVHRKLALKYHPDHNANTPTVKRAEVMADINSLWQAVKADAR